MSIATVPSIADDIIRGDTGKQVREIQEWLCLHDFQVGIDGDFGPATELAVKRFQAAKGLPDTGVVTPAAFSALVQPMREALAPIPAGGKTLGQMVTAYAAQHLRPHPREIGGENRGPWVRLYMHGQDGAAYLWCAGFACFILKQACETLGQPLPITPSDSCDALAKDAKTRGLFLGAPQGASRNQIKEGSFFLWQAKPNDWQHTGIVTKVNAETFETIEGNTNDDGASEGYEVCKRVRGFGKYDFIMI